MTKLSINEAAKRFDVSRPTLLKHLKEGKISGSKLDGKGWEIDGAELARVYQSRPSKDLPSSGKIEKTFPSDFPTISIGLQPDLQAEIERLKAEIEAEREARRAEGEALRTEREARRLVERHLDDLRRLLPSQAPERPIERSFWSRLIGR